MIGVGSTAFNNVNEFYGAISSIKLPLGDETLSIGADALADANDFDTVLAAVKAAFEEQSRGRARATRRSRCAPARMPAAR